MSQFELINGKIYKDGVEDALTTSELDTITFLGASVSSVTASIGWDGSRPTCCIDLAEDWAENEVFEEPVVGTPKFFKIRDTSGNVVWEFNGLVKNTNRSVGTSSGRIFTVTLESPEVVLEAAAIITDGYTGEGYSLDDQNNTVTPFSDKTYNWSNIYNIINVLGFYENDQYGVDGASFGRAELNDSGMPWRKMIIALNEIINRVGTNGVSIPANSLQLGGSLAFGSTSYQNGSPFLYAVNFDIMANEILKSGLPDEYRVPGGGSLVEIIQDLCGTANCQWMVTLEENTTGLLSPYTGTPVHGVITIQANSLNSLPDIGVISGFGLSKEGSATDISTNGALVDYLGTDSSFIDMSSGNLGVELADITTAKIVTGGKRTRMTEHSVGDTFMYWGSLQSTIAAYQDIPLLTPLLSPTSDLDVIPVDLRSIIGDITLGKEENGRTFYLKGVKRLPATVVDGIYYASILEIRSAAVDQESWENYLTFFRQKKSRDIGVSGDLRPMTTFDKANNAEVLNYFATLKANKQDTTFDQNNLSKSFIDQTSNTSNNKDPDIIQEIWVLIQKLYNDYYGKEYLVPMPVSAYKWEPESKTFTTEWEITDSAYTDDTSGPSAPSFDIKFAHESGRTIPYVGFPASVIISDATKKRISAPLDFSEFGGKDTTTIGNKVFIKSNVDPTPVNIAFPIPITFNAGVYGNREANIGYRHPQILTGGTNSDLNNSKPTSAYYGFYSDIRGAVPFARISLPGRVKYMKNAVGFSSDFDGIGLIAEILFKSKSDREDRSKAETAVGSDRARTPIAGGFYHPELLSVALKSNRYFYGPWIPTFNNYIAGKVEIDPDTSLVPENFVIPGFGLGHVGLDYFGYAKSLPDRVGYFATENGTFTLAGVSKVAIGETLIKGGPYLTDVNISIDPEAGVQTTFSMKTWSLDFGRLKKHFMDRFKKISQASIAELKRIRQREQTTSDFAQTLSRRFKPAERYRSHSSASILTGVVQPTLRRDVTDNTNVQNIMATSVSIMPVHNFVSTVGNDYANVGACSLDSLFTPFSCDPDHSGNLPRFDEDTPEYHRHGTNKQLNPLLPSGPNDDEHKYWSSGTNIHMVARGDVIPPDLNIKVSSNDDDFHTKDPYGVGGRDIRGVGLRTPQITTGYGYEANGGFVPSGIEEGDDLYHLDTANYKVGPDLRVWDDHKKIWIGDFPVMKGLLLNTLNAGSIENFGRARMVRYTTDFTAEGDMLLDGVTVASGDIYESTIVREESIFCEDESFGSATKGSLIYYRNVDGFNMAIYGGCEPGAKALVLVNDYLESIGE